MIDFILWVFMLALLPLSLMFIAHTLYTNRAAIIAALLGKGR
jgi:hypothetical protein